MSVTIVMACAFSGAGRREGGVGFKFMIVVEESNDEAEEEHVDLENDVFPFLLDFSLQKMFWRIESELLFSSSPSMLTIRFEEDEEKKFCCC